MFYRCSEIFRTLLQSGVGTSAIMFYRCSEIFHNLLQSGVGTSAKKLDEDLDIPWHQKVAM